MFWQKDLHKNKKIIKGFISGKTIVELSQEFNFTKLTIERHIKKNLPEDEYKNFIIKNKAKKESSEHEKDINYIEAHETNTYKNQESIDDVDKIKNLEDRELFQEMPFSRLRH